jgi:hypothetical protein
MCKRIIRFYIVLAVFTFNFKRMRMLVVQVWCSGTLLVFRGQL